MPLIATSKVPMAVVDEEQHLIGIIIRGAVLAALADNLTSNGNDKHNGNGNDNSDGGGRENLRGNGGELNE